MVLYIVIYTKLDRRDLQMKTANSQDMTVGNPTKLIFSFSVPILIGNVFQQLYNMVDAIIVGQCIDTGALAAVGNTGPMNFLIMGFVMGITGGFGVVIAQRFGAKDELGLKSCVATSILLSIAMTILLTTIALLTAKPLLRLINTPSDIYRESYEYISVIFWGIGATMLYNMMACMLRAIGDSKTPLYFLILSSILNIILDFTFILIFSMGVAGAAWATVISQAISGILSVIYAGKRYKILRLSKSDFRWNFSYAVMHLRIGLPMAFQFSITAIGVIILQGALNLFGTIRIGAYAAGNKVEQLVTQPASTFGLTMATYAGQNLGANRIDRIKDGVKKCTKISIGFSIGASILLFLFSTPMLSLFAKGQYKQEMIQAGREYLYICALFFPFLFLIFIYRNVLQGIGRSFMPLMAGVFELVARSIAAYTLPSLIGFSGVCIAGPLAWIAAAVPLGIAYHVIIKSIDKSYNEKEQLIVTQADSKQTQENIKM